MTVPFIKFWQLLEQLATLEEVKELRRKRGEIKSRITKIIKDLTCFLDTVSRTEIAGMKITLQDVLIQRKQLNENLYEVYDDIQLSQKMTTDLEYVKSVSVMIASLAAAFSQVKPKEKHEIFSLPKLTLHTFEGNSRNLTSYWHIFKCSVHESEISYFFHCRYNEVRRRNW